MKRLTRVFYLVVACLITSSSAYSGQDAGFAGSYLNYAGGAQVSGMGRAFVGLAEGIDSVAWNPAGLALLRPNIIGLLHTQTVESASLDYIGYVQPIYRLGGVGLGYVRLDSGSLPETNEYNQELGKFRDVQQTFMLAYGYSPIRRFSVGGTFKFSQQELSGVSANGWGLDLGVLGTINNYLRAGARIQNLMPPALKYDTATDEFPRLMTVGVAARLAEERLVLTMDLDKALDAPQGINWKIGAEGTFFRVAKLRAGFDFALKEFTFGLGYLWGRTGFDYSSSSNQSGLAHRFGMNYSFGGYEVMMHAKPTTFSPIGLVKKTKFNIQINHARPVYRWELQIRNQSNDVVHSIRGSGKPPSELSWDGKTGYGMVVSAGNYSCTLAVTDVDGQTETTPPQIVRVEYGTPLDTLEMQTR